MEPYDDAARTGVYTFHLLRSPDGAQHVTQYHGSDRTRAEFFSLSAGRRLQVTLDGSWQGERMSAPNVARATGMEWPIGPKGEPCSQPGAGWPDPWWDRRHRCPLFRACWRLVCDQALPYADEIAWIVCDVERRCDGTRCARDPDDELMYDEHLHSYRRYGGDLERLCEGFGRRVDLRRERPVAVLRALFDEDADRSHWHYVEYTPQLAASDFWQSSGWAAACGTIDGLIDEERAALASALHALPAIAPEPVQLSLEL